MKRQLIKPRRFLIIAIAFIILVPLVMILMADFLDLCFNLQNSLFFSKLFMLALLSYLWCLGYHKKDSYFFIASVVALTAIILIIFAPFIINTTNIFFYFIIVAMTFLVVLFFVGGIIYRISLWNDVCKTVIILMVIEFLAILISGMYLTLS